MTRDSLDEARRRVALAGGPSLADLIKRLKGMPEISGKCQKREQVTSPAK